MASSKKPAQGSGTQPSGSQSPSSSQHPSSGQYQTGAPSGTTPAAAPDVNTSSLNCVIAGLAFIGIKADANTSVDFGAIDSDALCVSMAHAIESCMAAQGWIVKPLSSDLKLLRKQQRRAPVSQLASNVATYSVPASSVGGGSQ
ncbi:MAG TPA: hypothetical protein VEZ11_04925 [Thermoanaerobaculia bacterium]|nr:hypothetical protein [Thermoanaerobaculia bacterium]